MFTTLAVWCRSGIAVGTVCFEQANIFAKAAEAGIRWVRYYLASMIVASAGQNLRRVRMKRVSK
jgi:hypothetical protein